MPKRNRLDTQLRKTQMLEAALSLAAVHGFNRVTREQIARVADCSTGLVSLHCGTMPDLRRDIVRAAVRLENLVVLGQAIAAGDAHARRAPEELKRRALDAMANAV